MTWNYRLMEFPLGRDGKVWEFREVYYDVDGNPMSYTMTPARCECFSSWETDPKDHFDWLLIELKDALEKPILRPEDFKGLTP